MKKNVVKINENTLRQIVAESVRKTLNEMRVGQEVEDYFGVLSQDDVIDAFIEWAENSMNQEAVKEFYAIIRQKAIPKLKELDPNF